MQGKLIIKGAVVLGVTLTFTVATHGHTNQDNLSPDVAAPNPDVEPSPPHAKAPPPAPPRRETQPPITFPLPINPFIPGSVRSDHDDLLFTGSWILMDDDGEDGALAPEFAPLQPFTIDIRVGQVERNAFDLYTDGRQPPAPGGSGGIMLPSAVPAPGALALLGLAALAARRRRRQA